MRPTKSHPKYSIIHTALPKELIQKQTSHLITKSLFN